MPVPTPAPYSLPLPPLPVNPKQPATPMKWAYECPSTTVMTRRGSWLIVSSLWYNFFKCYQHNGPQNSPKYIYYMYISNMKYKGFKKHTKFFFFGISALVHSLWWHIKILIIIQHGQYPVEATFKFQPRWTHAEPQASDLKCKQCPK